MRNSLLANLITNVKLKKIKLNNDIFFPSNQSTNTINLINSNNRFNNDQNNLSIINKRKIKSLRYSFSKNKRIQMPKLKGILSQTKNQGNQSEIKFRNNSDIYLPILSKNNNTNNETFVINNNHRGRKIKILKKLILNGNQNLNKEIAINPVSLKLDF